MLMLAGCVSQTQQRHTLQEWKSEATFTISREVIIAIESALAFRGANGAWPNVAADLTRTESGAKAEFIARNVKITSFGESLKFDVWDLTGVYHRIEIAENEEISITPEVYASSLPPKGIMTRSDGILDAIFSVPVPLAR